MNTLQLKTLRDLWLYKSRTILVVLAIAIGTAAVGVATTSFIVMRRDLRDGYRGTNPAHAVLDVTSASESLAGRVAALPGIAEAAARRQTSARLMQDDGETRALLLWTLPDFDSPVGRLYRQPGTVVPPPDGSILLERSIVPILGVARGDAMTIRTIGGETGDLTIAGFVNDLAVAPTTVQPVVYGYISDETAAQLGIPGEYNQLTITVSTPAPARAAVESAVTAVTAWLEDEGVIVTRAVIPEPGVHLMQGSVDTGLLMIGILGGLTMLLSAFLVTNIMSAVIAQQVPTIGVLKALGGDRGLIFRQYGRMVLLFGTLALILAVPIGLLGAWFQSSYLAGQLNYDIPSFGLPWQTLLIQLAGALLVPALAALGPVRGAANVTIREALGGQGIGALTRGGLLTRLEGLPRLLALALRNIARRKVRLFLTLLALSLAGAMFMATFGLRSGLIEAIEILVGEFPHDIIVDFAEPASVERIMQEAAGIDRIERVEAWGVADARRVYDDGRVSGSFTLFGVPESTEIAAFANRAGRWLSSQRESGFLPRDSAYTAELYMNYETEKLAGRPEVESALALKINSVQEVDARLVGISLRPFEANAYMSYAAFEQATGLHDQAGRLVVYMEGDDTARQEAVSAQLVARYEAAGMPVLRTETAGGQRDGYRKQFDTLVVLLMSLAGLTAVVGGLGLANTMALNVLERAREIGVLRSMGAGRPLLRRLVLAEGLAVALISWVLAVLLALPLTLALDRVMGNSLLGNPLSFAFSVPAALGWLALIVVIGLVACWLPAEGAARMTIREALAYE